MIPERLLAAWETPWEPVGPAATTTASLGFLLVCGLALGAEQGWIPLLDGVNLVFHEAGHPLFGILGWEPLTILGGTFMQLLVPLLVAGSFWLKRQAPGTAVAGFWACENLLNIARYVGDARTELLPLVGGGEHDWANLLGRWGLLAQDTTLAALLRGLGWMGMLACWGWLLWRWRRSPKTP